MAKRPGKFDGIPTEEMFGADEYRSTERKPQAQRSVAQANCPECSKNPIGVLRQGEHLVWRQHYYTTWSGTPMLCRASNVAVCVAPPKEQQGITPPRCKHD